MLCRRSAAVSGPRGKKLTDADWRRKLLGMARGRAHLCGLLVLFYLALIGTVSFSTFDYAWTPSYFDDDDDDFLPLVTQQIPVVTFDILPLIPRSSPSAPVLLPRSSARPLLLLGLSPLRAPPLS